MIKLLTSLFFSAIISLANANTPPSTPFLSDIVYVEKITGLDRRLIHTFIDIESGFKPYLITITAPNTYAELLKKSISKVYGDSVKITSGTYSLNTKKTIINVTSQSEPVIIDVARNLYKANIPNFDMGIMQINVCHIKDIGEINRIFNPKINMLYGIKHVHACYDKYGDNIKEVVECYNKGMKPKYSYEYYSKFYHSFTKFF